MKKQRLRGVTPGKPFYLAFENWADGSIDADQPSIDASVDLKAFTQEVVESVDQYGDWLYIVECRCIRKVLRGKTRVIQLRRTP